MERIPSDNAGIKDQLKRAAISIPLNMAEGSGKYTLADRKRFYRIARGSALECAAICDVLIEMLPTLEDEAGAAKDVLKSVVNILTTVILK